MGCSPFEGPGRLPPNLPQTIVPSLDFTPSLPMLEPMVGGRGPSWAQRSPPSSGRRVLFWDPECKGHPLPAPPLRPLAPCLPFLLTSPLPPLFLLLFLTQFLSQKHPADPAPSPSRALPSLPLPGQLLSCWGSAGSGVVLSWSSGCRISGEGLWGARCGGGGDLQAEDPSGWWASPLL